mmetsp:Transcript_14567/g.43610  ORF Transcript_14567/g.43610 Transcript_14567/m.43610 type:complete len:260 (-) Transcript_14567:261-1040(-)
MLSLAPVALSFTAPVAPLAAVRTPAPEMFFSGSKAAAPKKAAKKPVKKAAKAAKRGGGKDYAKISTRRTAGSFVDVTGKPYVEIDTFVPQFDEIGVLPPIGRWDPLQIREQGPERYRRFVEMEIKHGRIAMAAVTHVLVTANFKWDGYCSYLSFPPLKFEDIPAGTLGSWAALPQAGWAQIVAIVAILDNSLFAQDPNLEPGDVVGDRIPWVRYDDPEVKFFKLNAERNNGRAAMMGITGMLIHEGLTGNPIFPIGETL